MAVAKNSVNSTRNSNSETRTWHDNNTVTLQYSQKKVQSTKKVKQIFQTKNDFITCLKLIINELGGSRIRADNVYFANNE